MYNAVIYNFKGYIPFIVILNVNMEYWNIGILPTLYNIALQFILYIIVCIS